MTFPEEVPVLADRPAVKAVKAVQVDKNAADAASRRHLRLFGVLARGRRGRFAALGVLLAANSALPLAGPLLLRAFIDRAVGGRPIALLVLIAGVYLGVSLLQQAVTLTAAYSATHLAWTATNELRGELTRHALELDLTYHGAHPPGEMIERVDGDVTALSTFASSFVLNIFGSSLTLAGVLVVVSLEDWRIGLGLAGFAAVAALTIWRLRDSAIPQATRKRAASAELFGEIEERLTGREDLRANGAGGHAVRRYLQANAALFRASMRAARASRKIYVGTLGVFAAGGVASLAAGTALFHAGTISLGTVYLLFRYTSLLREPLEQISDQLPKVQEAVAGYARVEALLAERPSVRDEGTASIPPGPLPVELDRVGFAYHPGVPVLAGLSLALRPGEVLGVVGRTGSGKTTLGRLLPRLADPTEGAVRVGGLDLRDVSLAEVRSRVGLVTQDVQLFEAGLRDNLTLFGTRPAADARLVEVLDELGLGRWYRALPAGLDTILGSGGDRAPGGAAGRTGVGVSAGEAQLLAFARVFLRDPSLVILDEPTSRLDPRSEALIERAVARLLDGRTAIVIAHRLGTVARADRILVLENGRVAEHGPRRTLAADPGSRFAKLLKAA